MAAAAAGGGDTKRHIGAAVGRHRRSGSEPPFGRRAALHYKASDEGSKKYHQHNLIYFRLMLIHCIYNFSHCSVAQVWAGAVRLAPSAGFG